MLYKANLRANNRSCLANVGSRIEMSTQDNMTSSKNVAYAIVKQDNKDDLIASPTSNTPVYDEVSVAKQ